MVVCSFPMERVREFFDGFLYQGEGPWNALDFVGIMDVEATLRSDNISIKLHGQ